VQTEGDAHSHNPTNTRTTQRTVSHPTSLKDLASAVPGRTTSRTMVAQTRCTLSAENCHSRDGGHQSFEEDLEDLIQAAADFWNYDADDLRLIRASAAVDPDGIRRALSSDPLKPFYGMGLDSLLGGPGAPGHAIDDLERKHHAND